MIAHSRYLLLMALMMMVYNWVNSNGEYVLSRLVVEHARVLISHGELAPQGVHVVGALPGAVDTRMTAGLSIPKMTTAEAATEILDGFESGEEDIYVGEMARGIAQGLAHDAKAVERQLASPG